jgi:hypothetical protein
VFGPTPSGFHQSWWQMTKEEWPEKLRELYGRAFRQELAKGDVTIVAIHRRSTDWGGEIESSWTDYAVVDLKRWTFFLEMKPGHDPYQDDLFDRRVWRRRTRLGRLIHWLRGWS